MPLDALSRLDRVKAVDAIAEFDAVTPGVLAELPGTADERLDVTSPYIRTLVQLSAVRRSPRQGAQRYLYAGADPVNLWDPSGLAELAEETPLIGGISGVLITDIVVTTVDGVVTGGALAVLATSVKRAVTWCDNIGEYTDPKTGKGICSYLCPGEDKMYNIDKPSTGCPDQLPKSWVSKK